MGTGVLVAAIILWIIPTFTAHALGKPRRRAGAAYGLFLGWLGVIILALLPALPELSAAEQHERLERRRGQLQPRAMVARERARGCSPSSRDREPRVPVLQGGDATGRERLSPLRPRLRSLDLRRRPVARKIGYGLVQACGEKRRMGAAAARLSAAAGEPISPTRAEGAEALPARRRSAAAGRWRAAASRSSCRRSAHGSTGSRSHPPASRSGTRRESRLRRTARG